MTTPSPPHRVPTTRLEFGVASLGRLPAIAREVIGDAVGDRAPRVFLVTDRGVLAAGHAPRARDLLAADGFTVEVFAQTHENPDADDVAACRTALGDFDPDLFIALGGGSSIDTAKGCAFVLAGGGTMHDYQGYGKARGTLRPLVAVPTTAGTGSEVQSFALIGRGGGSHAKMACGDAQAAPRVALLDPALTLTMPTFVTVCTGLDTLVHAVETAVTTARNEQSGACSQHAFELVNRHFPRVIEGPEDLEARTGMMLAAAQAGFAIEGSMLGAAHSMANPLTAHHDIPHGLAVGLMLPGVMRFNRVDSRASGLYAGLARSTGVCGAVGEGDAVDALIARVDDLVEVALRAIGSERALAAVAAGEVGGLAEEAAGQWTAQFNPRPIGRDDFEQLYRQALGRGAGDGRGAER